MRYQLLISCLSMIGLTACGGGGGGADVLRTGALTDEGGAAYPTLARVENTVSTVGGTRIGNNGDVSNITGVFAHNTGATQFSDGTVTLNSTTGNGLTGLDDGSTQVTVFTGAGLSNQMQYLTPVTITAPIGSGSAILGLVTDPSDIPTGAASAVFVGQSSINVASGAGSFQMTGTATTFADFGANDVDVTLNGFTSSSNPAPFDNLQINNMTLSGSGFSGGSLSTTLGGQGVDVVGSGASFQSRGSFFGFDTANSIPAEVGGGFRADGTSGELISGLYTGD